MTIKVLSDGDQPYDPYSLRELAYDLDKGECAGEMTITESRKLSRDELIQECDDQGTDPNFFLMEDL